jgi:putative hydroxymethylpyrimidine transport system permease protein
VSRNALSVPWRDKALRLLLPVLVIAGLVGAWQLAAATSTLADLLDLEPFLVPSPAEIASALWENRTLLVENAWVTLREIALGFGCALIAALAFAAVLHLSETLRRAFYPLIVASQTIPIPAIAPILVVWLGFGVAPKLVIVALICFFPIAVNTLDGLRSVEPEAKKMMRSLDGSRRQTLWRLEAPTALPYFFSGARIALAIAPIGAVFAELAVTDTELGGLGDMIRQEMALLQTAEAFAAVVVLSAMAVALVGLLALAERRVVTWR